jgi:hypothetical protein
LRVDDLYLTELEPPDFPSDPRTFTNYRSNGKVEYYTLVDGDDVWFRLERLATYRFPRAPEDGVLRCAAMPDPDVDVAKVIDQFYRTVTPYAFQEYGYENVHGCALGTPAGALVLFAAPRSGKTTLAAALEGRGLPIIADDAVIIDAAGRPALRPLPFTTRLLPDVAPVFGKPVLERIGPQGLVCLGDPVPLAAFVQVDRQAPDRKPLAGAEPVESATLTRLRPSQAFTELVGRAHFVDPDLVSGDRRTLSNFLRLTAQVPVFRLSYPSGLDRLGEAVDLLERLVREDLAPVG